LHVSLNNRGLWRQRLTLQEDLCRTVGLQGEANRPTLADPLNPSRVRIARCGELPADADEFLERHDLRAGLSGVRTERSKLVRAASGQRKARR
jgi:hypothetical protein